MSPDAAGAAVRRTPSRSLRTLAGIAAGAIISVVFACGDGGTGPSDLPVVSPVGTADAISDAENEGNPHFYFLPPVVVEPTPTGTFDPTVTPRVEICESDLTQCVAAPFATFSFGDTDDHVRLVAEDEHYILTWHTNEWALEDGAYYRLTVLQASFELGFVDVQVYANGSGRNARTGESFALQDGRTLPLKFRIEEGAAATAPASAASADGAAAVEAPPGALQEYEELTVEPVDEATTELPDDGSALPGTVYDFGPDGLTFEEPVELSLAYDPATLPVGVVESDLRVYLAGPDGWELLPGGSVDPTTKRVKGLTSHFSEFAILPGGVETCDGSGFGTLGDALAAVGPEGTITVCDGTHSVEGVAVSKPVTIQAEAGAAPVLQTTTSAALFIDGIATGSVVLDGLTFDYSTPDPLPSGANAYAIRLENEYDQIVIRNSTFNIDPASRGSVAGFASSVPTAAVTLDNVQMTGGVFGVTTLGPDVFVDGSQFSSTTSRAISYGSGASGTVQNSTFEDCLGQQCIGALSGGHVEIVGNDFGVPDLSGTRAASVNQIIRYEAGTTGLIEDNDFGGCGQFRCIFVLHAGTNVDTRSNRLQVDPAADPFNTSFHAVIRYLIDATGTIEGNTITSCFEQCISVQTRAVVTVRGNTITLPDGLPTVHAIAGEGGAPDPANAPQLVIESNTVTAAGIPSDPADPATYDLVVGISLSNSQATVSGNTITRAATGLASVSGASVSAGQDNVIQSTWVAVQTNTFGGGDASDDGRVTLNSSDILDYHEAMSVTPGDASSDVTCNFWGPEQSGVPQSFLHGNAPAVSTYSPWATAPIANGAGGACDGMPLTEVTVDPANAGSDPSIVATLAEALNSVAEDGTIYLTAGTHATEGLFIRKRVTIEADPAAASRPVVAGSGEAPVLWLDGLGAGPVTLQGFDIQGAGSTNVYITGPTGDVLLDDMHFSPGPFDFSRGVWVDAQASSVTVQSSAFDGGNRGVHVDGQDGNVSVVNSTFEGQQEFVVQGALTEFSGNTLVTCVDRCVDLFGSFGPMVLSDNHITVDPSHPDQPASIQQAIWAQDMTELTMAGNVIEGLEGGEPIQDVVWLQGVDDASVTGNTVSGAATFVAVSFAGAVSGSDNVVSARRMLHDFNDDGTTYNLQSNDFTGWVTPFSGSSDTHAAGGFTCNWWGTVSGPTDGAAPDFLAPSESFTPWATAPIAGGAGGACDGMPLTAVTVDPANAGSDPSIFATLDEALGAVAEEGRVGIADGTHVLSSDLWITKPVLIEGNGPGRPTIDGTATFAAFILQTPGTVTLRNLHVLGGEIGVNVREDDEPYDHILIDDVVVEAIAGGEGITAWVPQHPADGRRIDIVGSTVTGGARGISAHDGVPEVVVNNTTLAGQTDGFAAALEFGLGVTGTVEFSTFHGCSNACIQVGANDPTQGSSLIRNNELYPDLAVPTAEAIRAWGGSVQIFNNHIEGQGGTLDPNDHTTWPVHSSGILAANVGSLDFSGNTVVNTFRALVFESQVGTVTGSDNVIDVAQTAIQVDDVTSLALQNSDFTNFGGGWIGDLDADVTCNWWGDALNPPIGASDPSLYTPWATAPIANGAGGACDGGL